MSIIDRPKAPPVCHGARMPYSESLKRFVCHCGYGKPLTEYLAERSNYHLEDMTYQAKVEAVRSYIKGEPTPDWARETLAIESIRILKKAEPGRKVYQDAQLSERALRIVDAIEAAGSLSDDDYTFIGSNAVVTRVDHERSEVTVSSVPDPAVWCSARSCRLGPNPHHRADDCPGPIMTRAWGDRPPVPSPERERFWPRPAVADAAEELRGCRHQSPGVGLPCGFCLAEVEDLDRRSHAYLQGFFRRHGSLSRNPMEPSDLDQRIAQATAEGKGWERAEADAHEANARDWAILRPRKEEPNV